MNLNIDIGGLQIPRLLGRLVTLALTCGLGFDSNLGSSSPFAKPEHLGSTFHFRCRRPSSKLCGLGG